jgi:ATP/maltotriose-dependent transcriptional regulator MalT
LLHAARLFERLDPDLAREQEASKLIEATVQIATERGTGRLVGLAACASAVLYNGLGWYDAARDAAWRAFEGDHLGFGRLVVAELAEAAARTGEAGLVKATLDWLSERMDAREQLRTAHQMLDTMGTAAFAERARRELAATGETARTAGAGEPLTTQEARVARLARDGLSNPEIGARLFISARTVKYHLHKVFTKLGISSRSQLYRVLPSDPDATRPMFPADVTITPRTSQSSSRK